MWILADMWRIVDTRVSMRQYTVCNQGLLRRLSCQIAASLKEDWKPWVETAGGSIEDLLTSEPPHHKEALHQMKWWYKVMADRALLPA